MVFKVDLSGNETVLYTFTGGNDGAYPNAEALVLDWAGNLYGTTNNGGSAGAGVVFKVDPAGNETPLYSFTGGNDGANPNGVIRDLYGNLYGAASNGGSSGFGVVFKLDPSGNQTVLYNFTGGNDGGYSNAGLTRDFQGNLYGTASSGGAFGAGVVFKLDPSGNQTVLYSFTGGNDGGYPNAGVVRDLHGNLYGATGVGSGAASLGVVFKIDPSGHETVLHTFTRGAEGNQPDQAGVILDAFGNLYGTTAFGAAGGQGAIYKLDPSGNATAVYAFPGEVDGQYPYNNGVIFGSDGQLYGATALGGKTGDGVVYQLNGDGQTRTLYSLSTFTADGFARPAGGVIRDSAGNFYGTTFVKL